MDTLAILRTLATLHLGISLGDALVIADALGKVESPAVNLTTPEGRIAFARNVAGVAEFLADGKKIQAIKAVREASRPGPGLPCVLGLREAKDAVDALPYTPRY